jgi:hypothetical protein
MSYRTSTAALRWSRRSRRRSPRSTLNTGRVLLRPRSLSSTSAIFRPTARDGRAHTRPRPRASRGTDRSRGLAGGTPSASMLGPCRLAAERTRLKLESDGSDRALPERCDDEGLDRTSPAADRTSGSDAHTPATARRAPRSRRSRCAPPNVVFPAGGDERVREGARVGDLLCVWRGDRVEGARVRGSGAGWEVVGRVRGYVWSDLEDNFGVRCERDLVGLELGSVPVDEYGYVRPRAGAEGCDLGGRQGLSPGAEQLG